MSASPPGAMLVRIRHPRAWSGGSWAALAWTGLGAAYVADVAVLTAGFDFDPNDHDSAWWAAQVVPRLLLLVVAATVATAAGGCAVLAVARSRAAFAPLVLGGLGFAVAAILLVMGLQIGIPSVLRAQGWAVVPPL